MWERLRVDCSLASMGLPRTGLLLVVEAGVSGFYIALTRGLAPLLLSRLGYGLADIVLVNVVAYGVGVAVIAVLHAHSVLQVVARYGRLVHGAERVLWGLIPFAAAEMSLLLPLYSAAVTAALMTSIVLSLYVFGGSWDTGRLIAYRVSASAASSIVGQVVAVLVLAYGGGLAEYTLLYLLAMSVGLASTLVLVLASPKPPRLAMPASQGPSETPVVAFVFMMLLLSSTAIMGVLWAPYLMIELGAPDYLAASLGLAQTGTSVFASLFWAGRRLPAYRWAVLVAGLAPLIVVSTPVPHLHVAIAVVYAMGLTGANMLAGRIYAHAARSEDPYRAAAMLVAATGAAQVTGLATVQLLLPLATSLLFIASTGYALAALIIALVALRPVAVAPPHMVAMYSRIVYTASLAGYSLVMLTVKSYVYLTIRLTGFYLALLLLYLLYRVVYYLAHPP